MKTILDIVALFLIRGLVGLMGIVPESVAMALSKFLIEVVFVFVPRASKTASRNLEIAFPNLSKADRDSILNKSKLILARNIYHFSRLSRYSKDEIRAIHDTSELAPVMNAAREAGKGIGVCVISFHLGCFELFAQAFPLLDSPLQVLARGFGLPRLDAWWNGRRELFGNTVFSRSGGYKEMVTSLREGKNVAILCDQNVKANHATFVNFFGVPAATTKAVGLAGLRTRCPIICTAAIETSPNHILVLAQRMPDLQNIAGSAEEKIDGLMGAVHSYLESIIRKYPEQWMWTHRRFKTRPEGVAENIY